MALHEEHMDLFGNLSSGVYTAEKAVTSAAVSSNVIAIDPTIPNWDVKVYCTQAFSGTSTQVTLAVTASNSLSSGDLASPVTVHSETIATANLVVGKLYADVLAKGYKYFKVTITPDTTSSAAYTAGKVSGYVIPEFN